MKMPKGQGYYTFADGTTAWFHGLSASERRREEQKHGKVIRYVPGM